MDYIVFLVGLIIICFVVVIAAGFFEAKLKKKKVGVNANTKTNNNATTNTSANTTQPPSKPESDAFIKGRIYQMENGDFAKYIGGGKFLRVKK